MGYVAWKRPREPLVTPGDAVASFLDRPDLTTKGNCLSGSRRFKTATADTFFNPLTRLWTSEDQNAPLNKRQLHPFATQPSSSHYSLGDFLARIPRERFPRAKEICVRDRGQCDDLDHWAENPVVYEPRERFWFKAAGQGRWYLILFL